MRLCRSTVDCSFLEFALLQSITAIKPEYLFKTLYANDWRAVILCVIISCDCLMQVGVSAYNELFRLSPQAIQFFPKLINYREGKFTHLILKIKNYL
jgi:hypothetical protein